MQIYHSTTAASCRFSSTAVAIGNFDGVHCGHQALFAQAIALARSQGGSAVALTFSPHPARLFNPELAPPLITTPSQKLEAMAACGLDAVVIEPFNADFAALSPRDFIRQIIVEHLKAHQVVVGKDFVFGHHRAGNLETLHHLGIEYGFQAYGIDPVRISSIVASSTKIREFLLLGRVGGASMLLGRDYAVEGMVVQGKARGRQFGIPTANISSENEILPRKGVYAGWARLPGEQIYQTVINIGTNPTFERADTVHLEAHLLDFPGSELYGQRLNIFFTQRLRDEQRFDSVEELKAMIQRDIQEARAILKTPAITIKPLLPLATRENHD